MALKVESSPEAEKYAPKARTHSGHPRRPSDLRRTLSSLLYGAFKPIYCQFHMRILLNGPQDSRPGKVRFAYVESPAKRTHSRERLGTRQKPRALGCIRSSLAGVSVHSANNQQRLLARRGIGLVCLNAPRVRQAAIGWQRRSGRASADQKRVRRTKRNVRRPLLMLTS